jgi:hypothetical protein
MLFDPENDDWTPAKAKTRRRPAPQPIVPRERVLGAEGRAALEAARLAQEEAERRKYDLAWHIESTRLPPISLEEAEHRSRIEDARRLEALKLPSLNIISECAAEFGVTMDDARSSSRKPPIVAARHKAMYRMWSELGSSFPKIGFFFGVDHTTAMNAVGRYAIRHGLPAPDSTKRMAMRQMRVR